jgi:hypothetical protein
VRSYWEHVGEHIGNNKKSNAFHPPPKQNKTKKKKKKAWMPWVNATSLRWQQELFFA